MLVGVNRVFANPSCFKIILFFPFEKRILTNDSDASNASLDGSSQELMKVTSTGPTSDPEQLNQLETEAGAAELSQYIGCMCVSGVFVLFVCLFVCLFH